MGFEVLGYYCDNEGELKRLVEEKVLFEFSDVEELYSEVQDNLDESELKDLVYYLGIQGESLEESLQITKVMDDYDDKYYVDGTYIR